MTIDFSFSPNQADVEFLTQKINAETSAYGEAYPFAFFIRDDQHTIIAGANGYVIYGVIYTDQLWVDNAFRHQGFARALMKKIHQLGLNQQCTKASVSTMSFQKAQPFYEKLGYQVDFERHGHVNNSSCFFMSKDL
ncbi:MAG: GNAT family N-acetyltransferase [Gammaproteobacteria bacterium]|nr:GNAT family N-acetyltransferase [Gammaproteobacteria bacterium]MCH9763686.1 GNAT family N-acetyltransferase [Gammaproteobacteria bacterium]